jgi:glutathione S-transferase
MADPIIFGPNYSTYVRSVRMALEEKGAAYKLHEVDIFSGENQNPDFLARQPFGKVPAFEHDGFQVYETDAITRYIDMTFEGPSLQPHDARGQARMTQIIGIVNAYAYPPIVGKLVIQRLVMPKLNETPDEQAIAEALPDARKVLAELERLIGENAYAAGSHLSLADLQLLPVLDYLSMTPEGGELLADVPRVKALHAKLAERESAKRTAPQL